MADVIEEVGGNKRGVTCEFCESQLSAGGELIKRSGKARAFLDLDDDNAKLRQRVEALTAEVAAVKSECDGLRAQLAAAPVVRSSGNFVDLE